MSFIDWATLVAGILGLALADPIVAMIKVLLEERAEGADTADVPASTRMPLEGV